ncbi:MAG: hypothetical protein IT563_01030 [Alphaproteobacteria bacterium]|nr:hypothetical protein [Alphaproteobacteria bacterium]
MSILVRFVTRKKSGGVVHRDQVLEGSRARFGRSADNEAYLPDPRVSLYQAAIEVRANGVFAEGIAGADITVNGRIVGTSVLKIGDVVGVGPYDVTLVEPPAGHAAAVTVELARAMGDDLERLVARSRLDLSGPLLNRRRLSWGLSILVVALFLVWPVAAFFNPARQPDTDATKNFAWRPDMMWNSGEISNAHKPIAQQCNRCHQMPFTMVRDEACGACHEAIQHHADPQKFKFAELTGVLCESCHKEHNGARAITRTDQKLCSDCHGAFRERAPTSALLAVGDFQKDHPEFRPTVIADPLAGRFERISLAATPRPRENSGLTFPHDKHLRPGGIRGPDGLEPLDCDSCHAMAPGGYLMAPVTQEVHCARCHELAFEPVARGRRLPHGNAEAAVKMIREFYADAALRGAFPDPSAPEVVRRIPGNTRITKAQEREALAWADQQSQQATQFVFTSRAVCGTCHVVTQAGTGENRKYGVVKPQVAERWLPKGLFRHSAHATETCQRCHGLDVTDPAKWQARVKDALPAFADAVLALPSAEGELGKLKSAAQILKQAPWSPALARPARDLAANVATGKLPAVDGLKQARRLAEDVVGAAWSDESSDILLPGVQVCRECHVGDAAISWVQPNNRLPSTCGTCHYFHTPTQGPMHPELQTVEGPNVPGHYRTGGVALDGSLKESRSGIRSLGRK